MPFRINTEDGISRLQLTDPDTGELDPHLIMTYASSGRGKSLVEEELYHQFYRYGTTIIVISDVKNIFESAFTMFEPTKPYHLRKLRKFGCPKHSIPTKLYHPFTYGLPQNKKMPPIQIYTINIKELTRTDLQYLAEDQTNRTSIQILLEQIQKLKPHEGLLHLAYKSEEQTESTINLTKNKIKLRGDNPDDFFTRSKIGTEKTSSEINKYLQPFNHDYTLTPANTPTNLDIRELINDQKHYHIFSTKWIKDKRLKSFYILHLLEAITEAHDQAKHPILIGIPEMGLLTPPGSDGFKSYLAELIADKMKIMRNTGKGYSLLGSTQVYDGVHPDVMKTFNTVILGSIESFKEIDMITKSLRLDKSETDLIKSLGIGEFIVKAKEDDYGEQTWQKVRFFLPPHSHAEVRSNFFEQYTQTYPETLITFNHITSEITAIKNRIQEEVETWKDKENQTKREAIKKEIEIRQTTKTDKLKAESHKLEKQKEKAEATTEQIKELVFEYYETATGKDKSLRRIAEHFNLKLSNGQPNPMAVQRIINQIKKKKQNNDTNIDEENNNNEDNTFNDDEE